MVEPTNPINELDLVLATLDLAPEARSAYLRQECGNNANLQARVLDLVRNAEASGSFMGRPALEPMRENQVHGIKLGDRLDRYRLMEQIGEGGMGIVYVAEQVEPVRRKVALKVIKPGMDSKSVLARFDAERQALAMMDHQNIARILDAGTTQHGLPFFVMELVRGLPITTYCDQSCKGIRERMALFGDVCRAIQHAHQKGIIHRDIKPSNVLVTLHDGKPIVKVIDFGVAKALHQPLSHHTIYTALNQVIGTPLYMSPEQLELSGLDIDTRTDIYSLGVLLYELLTGCTPFDQSHLMKSGFQEMRRIIREDDPPRPSQRVTTLPKAELSTAANRRGLDDRTFSKSVANDVDWIVLKAMEKDRNRRYESASGLAEDVQRYLNDEPVLACPPSWNYRVQKLARKHRASIGIASTLLIGLVIGLILTTWQWRRATVAEKAAVDSKTLMERQAQLATERLALAEQTIDEMYTRFASDWISQQSGLDAVQQEFLEKALLTYDKLAALDPTEKEPRLGAVIAVYRASLIHRRMGKIDEATRQARQCIALVDQALASKPMDAGYLLYRSQARLILSNIYKNSGETKAQIEVGDEVFKELLEISGIHDLPEDQMRLLAGGFSTLAVQFASVKSRESEARRAADLAVSVAQELIEKYQPNYANRSQLAASLKAQGTQRLWWGNDNEKCLASYQSAMDILRLQVQERPDQRSSIQSLIGIMGNLSIVLERLKRTDEKAAIIDEQVKLLRGFCERFPEYPVEWSELGDTLRVLAVTEQENGNMAAADAYWSECMTVAKILAERFPMEKNAREGSARMANAYGIGLMRRGDLANARKVLEETRQRLRIFIESYPNHRVLYSILLGNLKTSINIFLEQKDHSGTAMLASEILVVNIAKRGAEIKNEPRIDPLSYWEDVWTSSVAKTALELCMVLLDEDKSLTESDRNSKVASYTIRLETARDHIKTSASEIVLLANDDQKLWSELASQIDKPGYWKFHGAPLGVSTLDDRCEVVRSAMVLDAFCAHRLPQEKMPSFWPDVVLVMASSPHFCSQPNELLAICRRGLEQMPDNASAQQALAWTLFRCGQDKECRELLESQSMNPENGFILSMALARIGERRLAQETFDQASTFSETEKEMLEARRAHEPAPQQPNLETLLRLQSEASIALQDQRP